MNTELIKLYLEEVGFLLCDLSPRLLQFSVEHNERDACVLTGDLAWILGIYQMLRDLGALPDGEKMVGRVQLIVDYLDNQVRALFPPSPRPVYLI